MLNKALTGRSVTISVLGSSGIPAFFPSFHTHPKLNIAMTTQCQHATVQGEDPISPTCYPSCFFQWGNTVFPHPATKLTNGALRRTNWGYFGYCNLHHLPHQTDLVMIELDTEDEPYVSFVYLLFLFIPPVFLSFLFASVRYRSDTTALRPPYKLPSYRHLNDGLSHTKPVGAHEAHPIRLLIYPLP